MIFLKSQSNKKRLTKLLVIGFLVLAGLGFGGGVGAQITVVDNTEILSIDHPEVQEYLTKLNGWQKAVFTNVYGGGIKRSDLTVLSGSFSPKLLNISDMNDPTVLAQELMRTGLFAGDQSNAVALAKKLQEDSQFMREQQERLLQYYNSSLQQQGEMTRTRTYVEPDGILSGSGVLDPLQNAVGSMISWVLYYIAVGLDRLLMLIINVMFSVVLFNNFVNQPIVINGWAMIRDLCNGFFIILMMIMAAGITVKLPGYQWRSMLPKILLYAILVNFSLTITGLLIDFSQIVMLAFAAPLATTMGKGLILQAIGLPDKYKFDDMLAQRSEESGSTAINWTDIITALLFAVVASIIAIVVVGAITLTLIWRIILLVFLCVLSPLPYIARSTDKITQIGMLSSEWNSRFTNMLVVGPAMMFFLYLSFNAMQLSVKDGSALLQDENVNDAIEQRTNDERYGYALADTTKDYNAITNAFSLQGLFKFLLVVGFLWLSLEMGKKFGDAASSIAGKAQGKVLSGLKSYSGFNLGMKGVKAVADKASALPGTAVKMAGAKLGTGTLGLTSVAVGGLGSITGLTGLQKLGEVGKQWRQDVLGSRRKNRQAKLSKFMGKIGAGSDAMKKKWGEFTDTDFAKGAKNIGLGATSLAAGAGAALGLTALTVGTGGAILPTLAAGYLGGGGRLLEMGLGKMFKSSKAKREAKKQKQDEDKSKVNQVVKSSEEARDKTIEEKINTDGATISSKRAQEEINSISSFSIKKDKRGNKIINRDDFDELPNDFRNFLIQGGFMDQNGNLSPGQSQKDLERFKNQFEGGQAQIDRRNRIDLGEKRKVEIKEIEEAKHQARVDRTLDGMVDKNTDIRRKEEEIKQKESEIARLLSQAGVIGMSGGVPTVPMGEINEKQKEIENLRKELAGLEAEAIDSSAKDAWVKEGRAKADLQLDTNKAEEDFDSFMKNIDEQSKKKGKITIGDKTFDFKDLSGSDLAMKQAEAKAEAEKIKDQAISQANQKYNATVEEAQPEKPKPGLAEKLLADYEPYAHPNWVSQAVAEDATKEERKVKNLKDLIEAGGEMFNGFGTFSSGSFYSNSGMTSTQYKFLDAITKSEKGIASMVDSLKALPNTLSGPQAQIITELKKGIAAYKKSGGDTTKLSAVITILNDIKAGDKDKRVEEYEETVKEKK